MQKNNKIIANVKILPIFMILIFIMCSCNNRTMKQLNTSNTMRQLNSINKSTSTFKKKQNTFYDCVFEKNDIKITYPQLENGSEKLNGALKKFGLSVLDEEWLDLNKTSVDMNYKIIYLSRQYLSVKMEGIRFNKGGVYPSKVCITFNYDLQTDKQLKLTDVYKSDISELTEKLLEYDKNKQQMQYIKNYHSERYIYKVLTGAKKIDGRELPFCFNKNKIIIYFPVIHVLGDYATIRIDNKL